MKIESIPGMILIGNINLAGLNIGKNPASVSNQATGFDNVFDELLKLLFENQDTSNDGITENNLFIFPFTSFQNFLLQDIKNFQELSQSLESSSAVKSYLLNLLQSGQFDIKELSNLLQNLKSQNKYAIQGITEGLDEKLLLNKENPEGKELVNLFNSEKAQNNQVTESFKLNIQPENSNQKSSIFLNIVNEISEENHDIKPKIINAERIEKTLNNEASQLNIFSGVDSKGNDIKETPQKQELPVTQLKEVSTIIFKALSSSQKTIIVQLEPPELGRILIKLSMDNAGVRADMKVDYPHVKEMLTGLIPEIKSNLQSSGVKVSDFLLDLSREQRGYSDSYNGQGQKRYRGNQKFFEYFV